MLNKTPELIIYIKGKNSLSSFILYANGIWRKILIEVHMIKYLIPYRYFSAWEEYNA